MAAVELAIPELAQEHAKLVCEQLNEKHRRWVAGLLSEVVGYGGTTWVAEATGLDPKTIRRGRREMQGGLSAVPRERVRRLGGGRRFLKK